VIRTGSEPELDHLEPVRWGSVLSSDSTSELNLGQVPGSENSWKNRTEPDFGSTSVAAAGATAFRLDKSVEMWRRLTFGVQSAYIIGPLAAMRG
jgi:hypothetical protein